MRSGRYDFDQGKVITECETLDRERFEQRLRDAGWKSDVIYRVDLIHEAGSIWPV